MGLPLGVRHGRRLRNAIGWWPLHEEQYDKNIAETLEDRYMLSMTDLGQTIKGSAEGVPRRPKRGRLHAGSSPLEQALRSRLRCATLSAEERQFLLEEMWRKRHVISTQRLMSLCAGVLADVRDGDGVDT